MGTSITASPVARSGRDEAASPDAMSSRIPTTAADDPGLVARSGGRAEQVRDPAVITKERFPGGALLCRWPEPDGGPHTC